LDSDTIADKILKNQHFHKASQEEREQIVTGILAKGPAGVLATKMAHAVADKHETYRQARLGPDVIDRQITAVDMVIFYNVF
jgi:hypothetical protein